MAMNRDNKNDEGPFEKMGEELGGFAGRATGQATDMAMNAAGSVLSAAVEVLGDWWSSDSAREASRNFSTSRDSACRKHFESSDRGGDRSYESTRPLYEFGHLAGQNPDYQGRSFSEVEPELKRTWGERQSESFGDWPAVRGFVGFGYEGRRDDPLT